MSVEVRIPKEITEYKEKIIFGLSIRQLVCFTIAIVAGVTTYVVTKRMFGADTASYIVIVEVMPVFAIGFIQKDGFPFEKYVAMFFRHMFGNHRRVYKTELAIETKQDISIRSGISVLFKQKEKANNREYSGFEITEKDRKRKRQEARRKIEIAKQEYRTEKQRASKAAKKGGRSQDIPADYKV